MDIQTKEWSDGLVEYWSHASGRRLAQIHQSINPSIHRPAAWPLRPCPALWVLLPVLLVASARCYSQCCPPIFTAGPDSQSVTQGTIATFSVTVSSSTQVAYQWYFN